MNARPVYVRDKRPLKLSHVMREPDFAICEQQSRKTLASLILSLNWPQTPKTAFFMTWIK